MWFKLTRFYCFLKMLKYFQDSNCHSQQINIKISLKNGGNNSNHTCNFFCISGFKFHPEHELAKKQTSGHCGVVSFYIKNGTVEDSKTFIKSLKYFNLAVSLGSFESLVELPLVLFTQSLNKINYFIF